MANMIHSMAGGRLGSFDSADFAKVKILDGSCSGQVMFLIDEIGVEAGDVVIVPIGKDELADAQVLRVDRGVNEFSAPVSRRRAKKILKIKTQA